MLKKRFVAWLLIKGDVFKRLCIAVKKIEGLSRLLYTAMALDVPKATIKQVDWLV